MLEQTMEKAEKERIDFDIDRIMANNPFRLMVEDNCADHGDVGLKNLYLKSKTKFDKLKVYLNWVERKLDALLKRSFHIDDICGDYGSPSKTTRKMYETEGTLVIVSFGANTLNNILSKHFFVEIDKKGNFQEIVDLVREYGAKVEEGYKK